MLIKRPDEIYPTVKATRIERCRGILRDGRGGVVAPLEESGEVLVKHIGQARKAIGCPFALSDSIDMTRCHVGGKEKFSPLPCPFSGSGALRSFETTGRSEDFIVPELPNATTALAIIDFMNANFPVLSEELIGDLHDADLEDVYSSSPYIDFGWTFGLVDDGIFSSVTGRFDIHGYQIVKQLSMEAGNILRISRSKHFKKVGDIGFTRTEKEALEALCPPWYFTKSQRVGKYYFPSTFFCLRKDLIDEFYQ